MPPAPLGGVVMDRPLAVAFRALEPGTAWMFNADPDLLGFLIKLHICHGPGRRNPSESAGKVLLSCTVVLLHREV
jgi:hypothetical protein